MSKREMTVIIKTNSLNASDKRISEDFDIGLTFTKWEMFYCRINGNTINENEFAQFRRNRKL